MCDDMVRTMLDEHFILWGGDTDNQVEALAVATLIGAERFPCLWVIMPGDRGNERLRAMGSIDERIGDGEMKPDAAVALLMVGLEELEIRRSERLARLEQQAEDRALREQQDREYE